VSIRGTTLTLSGYETVSGVRLSGTVRVPRRGPAVARLTVSGPSAARGTLTIRRSRTTGTLGGRRISVRGAVPLG
jgi:hypothetical protein